MKNKHFIWLLVAFVIGGQFMAFTAIAVYKSHFSDTPSVSEPITYTVTAEDMAKYQQAMYDIDVWSGMHDYRFDSMIVRYELAMDCYDRLKVDAVSADTDEMSWCHCVHKYIPSWEAAKFCHDYGYGE